MARTRRPAPAAKKRPTTKRAKAAAPSKPATRPKRTAAKARPKRAAAETRPTAAAAAAPKGVGAARVPTPGGAGRSAATARARAALARGVAALDAAALAPHVTAELRRRGDDAPAEAVVQTIATVAAGYRAGPGADPPWPTAIDLDRRVVEGLVDVYWMGDRRADPERREIRRDVRTWVRIRLAQDGVTPAGTTVRDTLAAIALGAWRPGELKSKAKILVNLVGGWFLRGLA